MEYYYLITKEEMWTKLKCKKVLTKSSAAS